MYTHEGKCKNDKRKKNNNGGRETKENGGGVKSSIFDTL
jgi:hypothetical protein